MKTWLASVLFTVLLLLIITIAVPIYSIILMLGLALFFIRVFHVIIHIMITGVLGKYR